MRRLLLAAFFFLAVAVSAVFGKSVSFVQITDVHLGKKEHLKRLERIVDEINRLPTKVACVVNTGDIASDNITDEALMDEGRAVLHRLNVPLHSVAGNHDILPKNLAATTEIYRRKFGELCGSAEYNGVVFVFLFTEPLRKGYALEGYDPFKSLEAALKSANGKPVIVFHHGPSVEDFYGLKVHNGWPVELQKKWERLLNAYNVRAVIAGHFHRDELHWLGKVPLYVSSSVASYWGRQATYRVYTYEDGRLSYSTQYLEKSE